MKIPIVVNQTAADQWRVHCPSMPGCTAEAASLEEAQDAMHMAVAAYICSFDATPPSVIDLVPERRT